MASKEHNASICPYQDFRNAWTGHSLAYFENPEKNPFEPGFREKVSTSIKTFTEYLVNERISIEELEAMRNTETELGYDLTDRLDAITSDFNNLSIERKLSDNAHLPYWEKCAEAIRTLRERRRKKKEQDTKVA